MLQFKYVSNHSYSPLRASTSHCPWRTLEETLPVGAFVWTYFLWNTAWSSRASEGWISLQIGEVIKFLVPPSFLALKILRCFTGVSKSPDPWGFGWIMLFNVLKLYSQIFSLWVLLYVMHINIFLHANVGLCPTSGPHTQNKTTSEVSKASLWCMCVHSHPILRLMRTFCQGLPFIVQLSRVIVLSELSALGLLHYKFAVPSRFNSFLHK